VSKRYWSVAKALRDFPSSVVLVGRRFGEDYHRIISQQRILCIKPQAYYHPTYSRHATGLVVPREELQGIADRYYKHNYVYIQNAIKIYERK
jgi:hypothetical protein